MSYGPSGLTADADFIVESILAGTAPWLQLSSETTLTYALFGGNSPFANWVGNDMREWELFPTPESLFLSDALGERIDTWARDFDRCAYTEGRGQPPVDDSVFAEVVLEGFALADLIREALPYYYVEATFLDSVPRSVVDAVDAALPDRVGFRKLDGARDLIDRRGMTFQPYGSRQAPPERSSLSAAISANLGRYNGRVREPVGDFWDKLDSWQVRWDENFIGLSEQRGGTPRYRRGFDRLEWLAEGLALQNESHAVLEGTHLSCGAAYLAISKAEWDAMLTAWS